jgi:hypothetical protein
VKEWAVASAAAEKKTGGKKDLVEVHIAKLNLQPADTRYDDVLVPSRFRETPNLPTSPRPMWIASAYTSLAGSAETVSANLENRNDNLTKNSRAQMAEHVLATYEAARSDACA